MDAFDDDKAIKAAEAKDAEGDFDRAMSRQQIKDFKARGERPPYTPGNGMNSDESWTAANTVMAQKEKKGKSHHKKHQHHLEKEEPEQNEEEKQEEATKTHHKSHAQKKQHKKPKADKKEKKVEEVDGKKEEVDDDGDAFKAEEKLEDEQDAKQAQQDKKFQARVNREENPEFHDPVFKQMRKEGKAQNSGGHKKAKKHEKKAKDHKKKDE